MLIGGEIDIKWSKNSTSLKMAGIGMGEEGSMNQALKFFLNVEKYKDMIGEYYEDDENIGLVHINVGVRIRIKNREV